MVKDFRIQEPITAAIGAEIWLDAVCFKVSILWFSFMLQGLDLRYA